MECQKISAAQVVILLSLSRVFNILSFMPALSVPISGSSAIIGLVLSFIQQAIMIIPALLLYKQNDGKSLLDICFEKSKLFGKIVCAIFFIVLFFVTAGGVTGFNFFMTNAVYPNSSVFFMAVSICIVCFFCFRSGLEGLARASCILFVVFLAGFIFICAVSVDSVNFLNFHNMLDNEKRLIIHYMLDTTAKSSEPLVLILLFPYIKGSKAKVSYWFLGITFIISLLASFFITGVLGDFSLTQAFPYFTLTSVIKLDIFQRLDSFHMVTWVFASFVHITLFSGIMSNILKRLLPKKGAGWYDFILFFIVAATSIWFSTKKELLKSVNIPSNIITTFLIVILPLILLFINKSGEKHGSKAKNKDDSSSAVGAS